MSTLGDDYSQALKAGAGGLQSRSELDLTANAIKIMNKLLLISLLGTAVVVISGKHETASLKRCYGWNLMLFKSLKTHTFLEEEKT